MSYYRDAKAGRLTPKAAKQALLEKARKNGDEAYVKRSRTWQKLETLEAQHAHH